MKKKNIFNLIIAVILLIFLCYCYSLEKEGIVEVFNRMVLAELKYNNDGILSKIWNTFKYFLAILFEYPWIFLKSDIFGYGVVCGTEIFIAYIMLIVFGIYLTLCPGVVRKKWKTENDYDHDVITTTYDQNKFERGEDYISTEVTTRKDFANKYNFWMNFVINMALFILFVILAPLSLLVCIIISIMKLCKNSK